MTIDRKLASKIWKAKYGTTSCTNDVNGKLICNGNFEDGTIHSWYVLNANDLKFDAKKQVELVKQYKTAKFANGVTKNATSPVAQAVKAPVTKQAIEKPKKVKLTTDDVIQFRLDVLHITFLIENQLEIKLKEIFSNAKNVTHKELFNYLETDKINSVIDTMKKRDGISKEVQIISKDGNSYNIDSFLNFSTFGETIILLIALEDNLVLKHFGHKVEKVGINAIEQWYAIIRDLRNTVAHRNNIDPLTLYNALATPIKTLEIESFNKGTPQFKRNYIINYLLFDKINDPIVKGILTKYNVLVQLD